MYKELFYTEDLINSAEEVVFEVIHSAISDRPDAFCHCDVCVQDIAAILLNQVPTKYESDCLSPSHKNNDTVSRLAEIRVLCLKLLPAAIETVKAHTHH